MNVIKFRGRRLDNGEWCYGFVYRHDPPLQCFASEQDELPAYCILTTGFADWNMPRPIEQHNVHGDTVSQFIGLKDKKGKEIYQGDLVIDDDYPGKIRQVLWNNQNAQFYLSTKNRYKEFIKCSQSQSDGPVHCDSIEVIGNIYDNPELPTSEPNDNRSVATEAK